MDRDGVRRAGEQKTGTTHQTSLVDFDPTGRTLAHFFLHPIVRGEHRALLTAEIRRDALRDAVGEDPAYKTGDGRIPSQFRGGRTGVWNGLATAPERYLRMRLY